MASRRAAASFARASAPVLFARTATAPARLRVAAHFASTRRCHQLPRQRPALQSCLRERTAATKCTAARAPYSTDSADKPSKIWDFEALQKLTSAPNPSITIVDVREPQELQSTGRIPGAVNIPVTSAADSFHISDDEFEDRFGYPRPPRDAEVVFYCRAGVRSRAAAALARDAGWTKIGEYPGSWADWFEKGGSVER